jgi:hypothetical protein
MSTANAILAPVSTSAETICDCRPDIFISAGHDLITLAVEISYHSWSRPFLALATTQVHPRLYCEFLSIEYRYSSNALRVFRAKERQHLSSHLASRFMDWEQ